MSFAIVHSLPKAQWRRFVLEHPAGNIFHTPEMFQVFQRAQGHTPELWAATKNGRILALLMPVNIALKAPLLRFLTTRAVVYGSVLCVPDKQGQEALTILLQAYKQHKKRGNPLFTELRNLSGGGATQPIVEDSGFKYEDHLNFLIDLDKPVEEIWRSVDGNVRTNVRKARRMGVVVDRVTVLEEVRTAYDVLANVYQRIQIPLAPFSLFEAAFDILNSCGKFALFRAYVDDSCIGVAFRLLYKDVIYAWYAGSNMDYAKYKANDLLNWHVLEWGAQHSFKCFDFGGAGKPDHDYGPRRFKAKFNGTLVNYGRNICVHYPLRLRFSEWGYELYRRYVIGGVK